MNPIDKFNDHCATATDTFTVANTFNLLFHENSKGFKGLRNFTIAATFLSYQNNIQVLKIGLAIRNPKDKNYIKRIGRLIATGRAEKHPLFQFYFKDSLYLSINDSHWIKDYIIKVVQILSKRISSDEKLFRTLISYLKDPSYSTITVDARAYLNLPAWIEKTNIILHIECQKNRRTTPPRKVPEKVEEIISDNPSPSKT